jgi:trans-2,3-dihydro-3-hydroxyanthranilate isomerase
MTGAGQPALEATIDQVDVFTDRPLAGNGLAVVTSTTPLDATTMLRLAQELRQFETIFLADVEGDTATARIFTPEEELTFAGHPILGAAAVLHARSVAGDDRTWTINVAGRPLVVTTALQSGGVIEAEMDQGVAQLLPPLPRDRALEHATALGLGPAQLREDLPTQVVSTGLPYLLLPVTPEGLAASRVVAPDLPSMLHSEGASFVYVLDPDRPEGRTWDNGGLTEDIATGSAAGPTAAYLVAHGLRSSHDVFYVHQGRFVGRPSRIRVRHGADGAARVGGPVAAVSSGRLLTTTLSGA